MSSKKRLDVAFPLETYEKIKAIAIETNQPRHHKSGEVTLTPVVLNLINLGLERLAEEGLACLSELSDKQSDKTSDNTITDTELHQKIRDYVDSHLENFQKSLEYSIELTLTPILEKIAALEERFNALPPNAPEEVSPLAIALAEQATKAAYSEPSPSHIQLSLVSEEVASAPVPILPLEPENPFLCTESPTALQGEEPSPSPNLLAITQAELARRLDKRSDYLTRNRDKKDFSDIDPEGTSCLTSTQVREIVEVTKRELHLLELEILMRTP